MTPSIRWRLFVVLASYLALLSCAKPKSETSCGFVQNVYGERVSWKSSVPVRLYLHTSVPQVYEEAIRNAANTWNEAFGREILILDPVRIGGSGPAEDSTNVIYFLKTWEQERAAEQARTHLRWSGDQMREADIRINGLYYTYYVTGASSVPLGAVNIEALLLHEFGHVLGLRHNDAAPSVMATGLKSNQDRIELQIADRESLKCEY